MARGPSICCLTADSRLWGDPDATPSPQPNRLTSLPNPTVHLPTQGGTWSVEKVIQVPPKKVKGWMLPEMPGECPGDVGSQKADSWPRGTKVLTASEWHPCPRPDHRHPAVSG